MKYHITLASALDLYFDGLVHIIKNSHFAKKIIWIDEQVGRLYNLRVLFLFWFLNYERDYCKSCKFMNTQNIAEISLKLEQIGL